MSFTEKASAYVEKLVSVKPNRRTGSKGNKEAVGFFKDTITQWGYDVDTTQFPCLDYQVKEVSLNLADILFEVYASPYSLRCDAEAELVVVSTVDELESVDCEGKILLMKDNATEEQLMPKNFVFYNPDEHKHIIKLLETKKSAGIVTATAKSPMAVGAIYPSPMIVDGDFDIPSVYCTDVEGEKISQFAGQKLHLVIDSQRIETTSSNVIASKNREAMKKVVICAHIDAYEFTPGALDNASGTSVLLILAEILENYDGDLGIEIIAFNGEDHYSVAGQMDYLKRYSEELSKIVVAVNIDDVGYIKGNDHFSSYGLPLEIKGALATVISNDPKLGEGEQWYQGDHMIFVQSQVPCVAVTAENMVELMQNITHTMDDLPELVDPSKLVGIAKAIETLIHSL